MWYFCLLPSFWRGNSGGAGTRIECSDETVPSVITEAVPSDWSPSVQIEDLRKEFDDGKKVAVRALSMNMYQGQITALLGHNGTPPSLLAVDDIVACAGTVLFILYH